ncbi:arf-GAP domain and FG repeat-containing protein 1-like isoform X2 [Haliotis rubra]|uniref:arf-GAP domain and FG repeat-containing protein 1-like isoform X2 n=1 Tax=Haliotis rubra TaxID=36100 RepID=UPI001EE4F69E|nr:arf-GAP domain and FG repeat-containing protein 1-like isoform X2 [Haliotis rubra]
MASNKRKQDEKHLKMLREMVALPHNKQCFDCHQRGPTYVDMTIGSFVCTSCSGILRGLNPPHRVKSISMASFSVDEMDFLKCHGNELCRKVFLGLYDSRSWPEPDSRDEQRVRDFMVQKYENKRWYVAPTESMKEEARRMNEVSASKQPAQKPLRSLLGENATKLVVQNNQSPQMNRTAPANPGPISAPPGAPQPVQAPQPPTSVAQPKPQPQQGSGFDLLGDLGGDPFASTPPASSGGGGFADFSNFGSQPTPAAQAPPPSAFPMSSAPLQPLGSSPATATAPTAPSAPPTQTPPNTGGGGGGGDKYAALADLDSVFGTATTTAAPVNPPAGGNVEWGGTTVAGSGSALNWGGQATSVGGGNINWNGTTSSSSGSAPAGWNSQPQPTAANSTSGIFSNTSSTTAANPFGGSTGTTPTAGAPAPAQPNPFGGAGQGFQQQQPVGFGQFGGQPTAQPAGAGFGQFGMQNGSGAFGTTTGGFPGFTQSAPAGANPGFGAQPQTGFTAAQQGFPTQPQGFTGGWGQPPQQPAGNPFMNALSQQQVPPRGSSTNPFL